MWPWQHVGDTPIWVKAELMDCLPRFRRALASHSFSPVITFPVKCAQAMNAGCHDCHHCLVERLPSLPRWVNPGRQTAPRARQHHPQHHDALSTNRASAAARHGRPRLRLRLRDARQGSRLGKHAGTGPHVQRRRAVRRRGVDGEGALRLAASARARAAALSPASGRAGPSPRSYPGAPRVPLRARRRSRSAAPGPSGAASSSPSPAPGHLRVQLRREVGDAVRLSP